MDKTVEINEKNIADYPQTICFINPKNCFYGLKIEWLKKRFQEGLSIRVLPLTQGKKIAGFIEYVPGEFAWRAVNARGYMFIHCLWVNGNKNKNKGLGALLVDDVIREAKRKNMSGVAVVTSNGAFMAKKEIFVKNGFDIVEETEDFQLLAKQFDKKISLPAFINNKEKLKTSKGWHIAYSRQCPWVARFIEEVKPILKEKDLQMTIKELTSAKEAQEESPIYSAFTLTKNGKLLADRYISTTRFLNILKKELK